MRTFSILLMLTIVYTSCKSDDRIENPFLPDINVNFTVNLNLPEYSDLKFNGNSVIINNEGVAIKGIIIYNVNGELFTAYELSDPNHAPNACSAQTVEGVTSTCGCDDGNSYNILTGQPVSGGGAYGLKAYRITKQGNTLSITN